MFDCTYDLHYLKPRLNILSVPNVQHHILEVLYSSKFTIEHSVHSHLSWFLGCRKVFASWDIASGSYACVPRHFIFSLVMLKRENIQHDQLELCRVECFSRIPCSKYQG